MEEKNPNRQGISIELEHIFPIIKKWLYSEKEIFIREIVSNACDAITKLRRLLSLGEAHDIDMSNARITVALNKTDSTITVTDTGIGMTEEELKKYICQIALSGALDFINKYEGTEADAQQNGIIGHFGLGFYSSFMVSDTVDIITKSYTDSPCVKWTCTNDGEYEISSPDEDETSMVGDHGTVVIMHINDDGKEFLTDYTLKSTIEKYCAFMPEPIFFVSESDPSQHEEGCECDECKEQEKEEKPINDTAPLWQKNPSDATDEEYKDFYRKVFKDWKEPLFHIHIKADYPLNFKGILYFPRISNEFESLEGQVKLYYNQVFVADNIKEVIPEYLLMLKGVLDCPELPLNVSRSYLQNSGYVTKISAHITKKVADKLNSMFTNQRENYESIWRDLKTFVEYGCMRDPKFYDRIGANVLYEVCGGGYKTLDEYLESAKELNENKIYYATDATAQSKYIKMFKDQGIEVVLLDRVIDTQFISIVEQKRENVKFFRVDAEVADILKSDGEIIENESVTNLFKEISGDKTTVVFDRFKDENTPALLNIPEESRRMSDMMRMYKMGADFPLEQTLILNSSSPLINKIASLIESDNKEQAKKISRHIYMLSSLSQRQLTADELVEFLSDSYEILGLI